MLPRKSVWLLLLLFAALWFGPLGYRKLVQPDEGRYAEIAREMVVSGDWTTPRLNDLKYFEKPALQYWATALAYRAWGEHEWTARLWPALTGFLGVLFTAFFCARLWGGAAALYAACVLGGGLLYGLIGHVITLDMGVSFFLSAAVLSFVLAQRDAARPPATRRWMWMAWACLACAVLSKGLIGLVLPGAALVFYSLLQRDFAVWKKLHLLSGLTIFLLIAAPWFIKVSLANPEFARFFFIHEHVERFLTKVHDRYQPAWYFIPILLGGVTPWLISFFGALLQSPQREFSRFQPRRFLLAWIAVVFVFFSVSDSKLVAYILPLFPALAALMGWHLSRLSARAFFWHVLPWLPLGLAGAWFAPQVISMSSPEVPLALYRAYVPWLIAACLTLALGAALALAFSARGRMTAAVVSLALGGLLFMQLGLNGHDSLSPANSAFHIAQRVRSAATSDTPIFNVNIYDQTLPFYLKRTVTLVNFQDELAFGIQQEPQKYLDMPGFQRIWKNLPKALALMPPETWQSLSAEGLPMRVIAQDSRRVIVEKP